MKKLAIITAMLFLGLATSYAQFGKLKIDKKQVDAAKKAAQAFTISDEELEAYVQEYVDWMDAHNPVCSVKDKDPGMKAVAERLARIVSTAPDIKELKLDVKAYYVVDVNAFACANGSIRVFAGLMDLMTDDQILGIIGHEVGHYVHKDTKDGFKKALLTSALKDMAGSTGGVAAALTDSQIGELGEALAGAQFSQKAEYAADEYGYEFLKKAGKDPRAMAEGLRVLTKLQAEAKKNSKMNQLFSSHPETEKRAARLDEMYAKNKK